MRVLFSGTRKELNREQELTVKFYLNLFAKDGSVIVGDCPTGVDKIVAEWCSDNNVEYVVYKANWDKYGKAAGPLRNKAMVASKPDMTIGFPLGESRGTWNCLLQASEKKLPVATIPLDNIF